jgi:predicted nuclease with TOPRIM domain
MAQYQQQQSQIDAAQSEASRVAGRATQLEDEIKHLQKRMDSLSMICRAMWELIQDHTPLTDEDIEQKIQEFKQSAEGTQAKKCSNCGRAIVRRQTKCLYCGTEVKKEHLFE